MAWSGFQTGLRFANGGARKPSWNAYRLPIVVHAAGTGVRIWGRVRPGNGTRAVAAGARDAGAVHAGREARPDGRGRLFQRDPALNSRDYRYRAFDARGNPIGTSRVATPVP